MKSGKFYIAGLVLLATLAATIFTLSRNHGLPPNFPVKDVGERGAFFRLKVSVAYKGTPQDFDIVVTCGVRTTQYADGSSSVEPHGLAPNVFGRVTPDGQKILAVRPPLLCKGETTDNGQVPKNFRPLLIVFQNPEFVDFGIAYVGDAAFKSPLSELSFGGASIHKATYEEFVEFRKSQPNAISPFAADDAMIKSAEVAEAAFWQSNVHSVRTLPGCKLWERRRLTEPEREILRQHWPADRPEYWSLAHAEANNAMGRLISTAFQRFVPELTNRRGFAGEWEVFPDMGTWDIGYFPIDPLAATRIFETKKIYRRSNADVRPGFTDGFAYCTNNPIGVQSRLDERVSAEKLKGRHLSIEEWNQIRLRPAEFPKFTESYQVNNSEVPKICRANASQCYPGIGRIYIRDEFSLTRHSFGLSSLKGQF